MKHKIDASQYSSLNLVNKIEQDDTAAAATTPGQPLSRTQSIMGLISEVEVVPKSKTKLLETLELSIGELYVTFCEETGLDLQPLAILRLQLNGRVSNWTRNLHLKATLSLEASYYNDRLSSWEPLIENCMQREDVYRPWLLAVWFAMEPGGILQPPLDQKGIRVIDFPVKDLDYSVLYQSKIKLLKKYFSSIQTFRIIFFRQTN